MSLQAAKERRRARLAILMKEIGPEVLARASGISPAYLYQMSSGTGASARSVSDKSAAAIERGAGKPPGWLDLGHEDAPPQSPTSEKYEFATRVYGAVLSAGSGTVVWEHEEVDGSHAFTRTWLQKKRLKIQNCRIVGIDGDSMLPELRHGFVVLIDTSDTEPVRSGKVYALSVDGELRIKRLFRQIDGSLRISSDNPDKSHYPDEIVPAQHLDRVQIIGRKRWHAGDDD